MIKKINKSNFDFDELKKEPFVLCRTKEAAHDFVSFLDECKKNNPEYSYSCTISKILNNWEYYRENTCYYIHNYNPFYYQDPYEYWVMFENFKKK